MLETGKEYECWVGVSIRCLGGCGRFYMNDPGPFLVNHTQYLKWRDSDSSYNWRERNETNSNITCSVTTEHASRQHAAVPLFANATVAFIQVTRRNTQRRPHLYLQHQYKRAAVQFTHPNTHKSILPTPHPHPKPEPEQE